MLSKTIAIAIMNAWILLRLILYFRVTDEPPKFVGVTNRKGQSLTGSRLAMRYSEVIDDFLHPKQPVFLDANC